MRFRVLALDYDGTIAEGGRLHPDVWAAIQDVRARGIDGRGRVKLSAGKALLPGRKQVFRVERDGAAQHDLLGVAGETASGRPLLRPVMRKGRRTPEGCVTLAEARANAMRELALLPPELRGLGPARDPYVVRTTDALLQARDRVVREVAPAPHAQEASP